MGAKAGEEIKGKGNRSVLKRVIKRNVKEDSRLMKKNEI